jgi:hypothetical protein
MTENPNKNSRGPKTRTPDAHEATVPQSANTMRNITAPGTRASRSFTHRSRERIKAAKLESQLIACSGPI